MLRARLVKFNPFQCAAKLRCGARGGLDHVKSAPYNQQLLCIALRMCDAVALQGPGLTWAAGPHPLVPEQCVCMACGSRFSGVHKL
jgi:hypothetical protein